MEILKIFISLLALHCNECANILYVIPFTSKSHNILLKPLGLELAHKGHNVTVITGHLEKTDLPNYHQIKIDDKEIWDLLGYERPNVFTMTEISAEEFHDLIFWRGGLAFTEMTLTSSQVKDFLAADNSFDLVISEQFFQEALYTLAHKYNTPLVLVTTYGNCMRHNIATRNPLQMATVIGEFLDLKEPSSFLSRLRNFYFTFYEFAWWRYWYLGKQEALAHRFIPGLTGDMPSLYEIQRNVSLFLVNGHFSFDTPTAYLPNIIEVGGMHLTHGSTKLPKDLESILDNSKEGVVYVNFGSNVRSAELPHYKKKAFVKVFEELNQTVLWKWEEDTEINSSNIVMRKWFPQKEILAHPKIKLFVSHGGLIGTQEAIFHGVPVIGVPIYADQYNNILQIQEIGFGKILRFQDITEETLRKVVNEVLTDKSYHTIAKEVSLRFKDRPMNALDTAVFWVEYVIRNKGANYMKNPGIKLNWAAYNMFDVYAFILLISILLLYIIIYISKKIMGMLCSETVREPKFKKL